MIYQDRKGRILTEDDINEMEAWEIEERGIHVYEEA
jgi:hypothetical protein